MDSGDGVVGIIPLSAESEAVQKVLEHLQNVKQTASGWEACCPAHDDQHASLSIAVGESGRVLLHCHVGCSVKAIVTAIELKLSDLFPPREGGTAGAAQPAIPKSPAPSKGGSPRCVVATYPYCDKGGALLFEVVRYEPKDFRQRRPDGKGGWIWSLDGTPRVLYRLPELLAAYKGARIFVCEGEKDVDNVRALNLTATCNPGGAGKWVHLNDDSTLHGRRVAILPDKDDTGRKHAEDVASRLHGKAAEVKVLELPGPGKDVSDWINAHAGADKTAIRAELLARVDAVSSWQPSEHPQEASDDAAPDDEIARLAALPILIYESCRKSEAKRLNVRVSVLDRLMKQAHDEDGQGQGHVLKLPELEPWPEPVDGYALLNELAAVFARYIVLPAHGADALSLWTVFAHSLDCFEIAPRLALISPEKRCGKTRTITILHALVPRPLFTSNISPAAIFRSVEMVRPTLLLDEGDTYIHGSDELHGILNSGHSRAGAFVVRVVGDDLEARVFSTWAAMAFGAIGHLPDTLTDRSIILPMVRKAPGDKVQRLRQDRTEDLHVLGRKAARWAADHADALQAADPDTPSGLHDRAADNWRALVAIADLAGGDWSDRAREAAVSLSGAGVVEDVSMRTRLLEDLRDMFGRACTDRLTSKDICAQLAKMEDRSWPEYKRGEPITATQIAKLLKPFGVTPTNVRVGEQTAKGYRLADLKDAFERYLELPGATQLQPLQTQANLAFSGRNIPENVTSAKVQKPLENTSLLRRYGPETPKGREKAFTTIKDLPEDRLRQLQLNWRLQLAAARRNAPVVAGALKGEDT